MTLPKVNMVTKSGDEKPERFILKGLVLIKFNRNQCKDTHPVLADMVKLAVGLINCFE